MKYCHLGTQLAESKSNVWQSGVVKSGVFLNVTFDYQAIFFTLLSAERKGEPLLDFARVWYAKTQLSYMHPLRLIWFLPASTCTFLLLP